MDCNLKSFFGKLIPFGFLLISTTTLYAKTTKSNGTGPWNVGATWDNGVPIAGDIVYIRNGDVVTVTGTANCQTLYLEGSSSGTSTLVVNNGQTLTISSEFRTTATAVGNTVLLDVDGSFSVGNFNVYCYDDSYSTYYNNYTFNITGTGSISSSKTTHYTDATLTTNIEAEVSTGKFTSRVNNSGIATINVKDVLSVSEFEFITIGTTSDKNFIDVDFSGAVLEWGNGYANQRFNKGTIDFGTQGTVEFTGIATILADPLFTYNDIVISGTVSLGDDLKFPGDFTNNGTFNASGYKLTFNSSSSTKQVISGSSATTFADLELDNSDASGGVTLSSNVSVSGNLSITDGELITNGRLTMLTEANIGDLSNGTLTGTVIAEKELTGLSNIGWRHLSMPLQSKTYAALQRGGSCVNCFYLYGYTGSNSPSAGGYYSNYTYNAGNVAGSFDDGWVAPTNVTNTFSPNYGIIMYCGNGSGSGSYSDYDWSISGTPYTGDQTYTVANSSLSAFDAGNSGDNNYNWALVGNPYVSAIDWSKVSANAATSGISATAYVYGENSGGYAATNALATPNIISAWQAFFVKVNGASPQIRFEENDKATDNEPLRKSGGNNAVRLSYKLTDTSSGLFNYGFIEFDDNSSFDYVDGEDAYHLTNPSPVPNISVKKDGNKHQVYSIPNTPGNISFPLEFEVFNDGGYVLELTGFDQLENCFVLEDHKNQTTQVLTNDTVRLNITLDQTKEVKFSINSYRHVDEVMAEATTCFGTDDGSAEIDLFDQAYAYNVIWKDAQGNSIGSGLVDSIATIDNLKPGAYSADIFDDNLTCPTNEVFFTVQEPREINVGFGVKNDTLRFTAGDVIRFENYSSGATTYNWSFGDGATAMEFEPTHVYGAAGVYKVTMNATNGNSACDQNVTKSMVMEENALSIDELNQNTAFNVYVTGDWLHFTMEENEMDTKVSIQNVAGQEVYSTTLLSGVLGDKMSKPSNGIYLVTFSNSNQNYTQKVLIE